MEWIVRCLATAPVTWRNEQAQLMRSRLGSTRFLKPFEEDRPSPRLRFHDLLHYSKLELSASVRRKAFLVQERLHAAISSEVTVLGKFCTCVGCLACFWPLGIII